MTVSTITRGIGPAILGIINLRTSARVCVIICLGCALDLSMVIASSHVASSTGVPTDFVDFWAASRLLVNGGNPFSPAEVLQLQQSVGYREPKPLLMWNPPWTLSFVLPIGFLDYGLGQFVWLLLQVFFLLLSAQRLWAIYSPTARQPYLPWIAAFTFVPTLMVLIIGQITPLVLLGVVGFLYFERKDQSSLGGRINNTNIDQTAFGLSVLDRIDPVGLATTSLAGCIRCDASWHNYRHHTGDDRSIDIFSVYRNVPVPWTIDSA